MSDSGQFRLRLVTKAKFLESISERSSVKSNPCQERPCVHPIGQINGLGGLHISSARKQLRGIPSIGNLRPFGDTPGRVTDANANDVNTIPEPVQYRIRLVVQTENRDLEKFMLQSVSLLDQSSTKETKWMM
jgi:hypothetical protein